MAVVVDTMVMDAMVDTLKQDSVVVQTTEIHPYHNDELDELPPLRPTIVATSNLCWSCKALFDCVGQVPASESVTSRKNTRSLRSPGRTKLPYHSLDDLAVEAKNGCHLCLTVYLGLDPEELQRFEEGLERDQRISIEDGATDSAKSCATNIGYMYITPVGRDRARVMFEFAGQASIHSNENTQPYPSRSTTSLDTNSATVYDCSSFISRPASSGYHTEVTIEGRLPSLRPQKDLDTDGKSESPTLQLELVLLSPQHALGLGVRKLPNNSTGTDSVESFDLARDWITNCVKNHVECRPPIRQKSVPTYLLDCTVRNRDNVPGVKLVDGISLSSDIEYVTLSHRWGPQKPTRLHSGTSAALKQGVARSSLPKTIAEAAEAVERLGYIYLWVDALCIMHDDDTAVLDEMSRMHKIYGSASLNIAATAATADTDGLYRSRNVAALHPCVLDVEGHDVDDGTYMILRPTTFHNLVDKAPLNQRAWVLQERALARRTLHFTRSELMWECRQMCGSEVHVTGIPDLRYPNTAAPPTADLPDRPERTSNWGMFVELFSAGRLTFQSDKLLAISGLARQYGMSSRRHGSEYIAGMWKRELPWSLLWTVSKGKRMWIYRAPTWSWASMEGTVKYPERDPEAKSCVSIIEIDVKNKHDDPFSLCEAARMKISGYLTCGVLLRKRDYWGQMSCTVQFPTARVRMDLDNVHFDEKLAQAIFGALKVYLLPIVCTPHEMTGLLLVATRKKGEFKRLGIFTLSQTDDAISCEKFKIAMDTETGMENYEDKTECTHNSLWFAAQHRYTVVLV